jgi:hypothetical protein
LKSLIKLGAAAVLLPVAIYAGAKSYVHVQTRSAVDGLRDGIAMFVALEYGSINSSLWSGTVDVRDVKLRPTGINDTIAIDRVSLSAGDLRRLIRLMQQAKDKQPPSSLGVALENLAINLNGELIDTLEKLMAVTSAAGGNPYGVRLPHCGGMATGDFAFLRRLGYDILKLDVAMNYAINPQARSMKYEVEATARDMTRFTMDMRLVGVGTTLSETAEAPQLRELGIKIKDLSYNERMKNFCAAASKITNEEYLNAEVEQGGMFQQAGISLGPALRDAYRDYLTKPDSEIEIRVRPNEDVDLRTLALFKTEDLLGMLNLAVSVNGKPVNDLSFQMNVPVPAAAALPGGAVAEAGKERAAIRRTSPAPTAAERETPREPEFRVVPVTELSRYVDHYVRLQERGQGLREGVLLEVTAGTAVVERRYGSGTISLKIPLPRIERAEVRF